MGRGARALAFPGGLRRFVLVLLRRLDDPELLPLGRGDGLLGDDVARVRQSRPAGGRRRTDGIVVVLTGHLPPHSRNSMLEMGCTSQIVGMSSRRLLGPG